ncbi:MAG: hypothetical protein EBS31_06570 [Burkholderiaceae bacterium]|nr:hypothetical protein [Burkholderiaceae bacterium]
MFGMIDYRARKFYLLLFSIPNLVFWLLTSFGYPSASYFIGANIAGVLGAIIAFVVIGFLWNFLAKFYMVATYGFFSLLVDVIPHNGRSAEEAKNVVLLGDRYIDILEISSVGLADIDDSLIDRYSKHVPLAAFFGEITKQRLTALRNYYADNRDMLPTDHRSDELLKQWGMYPSIFEKVLANPTYRSWLIQVFVFLLLVLFNW